MESSRRKGIAAIAVVLALAGCGSTVETTAGAPISQDGGLTTNGAATGLGGPGATTGVPGSTGGTNGLAPSSVGVPGATSAGGQAGAGMSTATAPTTTGAGGQSASRLGPAGTAFGVTDKTIKIGIFTVQGFSSFGASLGVNVSVGDQRAEAQAVIKYLNAHGGMAGRQIIPIFHDESVSGAASNYNGEMQAACAAWTQDNRVYALASAIGTQGDTLYQCLGKANVITSSAGESKDAQFFEQYANTFYMPVEVNLTRILHDNVDALYGAGFFGSNAKVGVVRVDDPIEERAVNDGLIPALAGHGLKLTDQYAISSGDDSTAQFSNAVLKFKAEGITHVLFTFASPLFFMTNAESQHYHPRYGLHSRSSPAALLQGNAPNDQLAGSMGIGWQQYNDVDASHDPGPPSPRAKLCLKLMRDAGQNTSVRATALVGLWQCDVLFFLHDALAAAPNFTLAGFRAGAESLAHYEAASTFRSGFSPGQLHDAAKAYRLFAFKNSCSCFAYVSGLRPAP